MLTKWCGHDSPSRYGNLCNCGAVHVYTVELSDADLLGRAVKRATEVT